METLLAAAKADPSKLSLVVIVGIAAVVGLVWLMRRGKL